MKEIVPGVYRLALPLVTDNTVFSPKATANSYLLRGSDGCMLVDTCWNTEQVRRSMEQQLAEQGLGWKDIKQVVYTHLHPDHYGLAGRFREFCPAPQAAHRVDIEFFRRKYAYAPQTVIEEEDRWFHRNGVPFEEGREMEEISLESLRLVSFLTPGITLEGGETIEFPPFRLKVFWTPGHSPGHICLYEPRLKLLFTGDHIVEMVPPPVPFFSTYDEDYNPMGLYLASLRAMETVDAEVVLPAHGRPFGGLKHHVGRIMSALKQKDTRVIESLDGQMMTAFEVVQRTNPGKPWSDLYTAEKRKLMIDTLSTLQELRFSGRIERVASDDAVLFRRVKQDVAL